ncbi:MAG: ATP-binding protein [Desulfuromonadales bacterium]|nr:ATP-binding protein [Desulfuromonadales bacterium]
MTDLPSAQFSGFWKRFLLLFIPISLLTAALLFYVYSSEAHRRTSLVKTSEKELLLNFEKVAQRELQAILSDLALLGEHHELQEYFEKPSDKILHAWEEDWASLSRQRGAYDQVRYLDLSGVEKVRVNLLNGKPEVAPQQALQDKSQRYYFQAAMSLPPGGIYISPFDLNVEHGQLQKPYKPTLRLSTPAVDKEGKKQGVVVLNYLGERFRALLDDNVQRRSAGQSMLLNQQGYWLIHPQRDKEFSFMFGKKELFGQDFPLAWQRIKDADQGQFINEQGLFTFSRISPPLKQWLQSDSAPQRFIDAAAQSEAESGSAWIALSFVPDENLTGLTRSLGMHLLMLWAGLCLLYFFGVRSQVVAAIKREQSHDELRQSQELYLGLYSQFSTLLNSIEDKILFLDADRNILWSNLDPKEPSDPKEHCFQVSLPTWRMCADCSVNQSLSTGRVVENEITDRDGRLWLVRAFPVMSKDNLVVNVIVISHDITDQRRVQSENIRTGQLASLGELAAGVAHEINNPITGVINYAQLLLNRRQNNEEVGKLAQRIINEGNRIAEIVRNMLLLARESEPETAQLKLNEIMQALLSLTRKQLEKDGIHLTLSIPEDLPQLHGHASQLQQLFLNLINNARYALNVKYPEADQKKRLEIIAATDEVEGRQMLRITFLDHGSGINPELLPRVLNPFVTTKPAGVGTGLGLSISHEIVKRHKGRIEVKSVEGEFTQVDILLPLD